MDRGALRHERVQRLSDGCPSTIVLGHQLVLKRNPVAPALLAGTNAFLNVHPDAQVQRLAIWVIL
jgi:hypothetical protein